MIVKLPTNKYEREIYKIITEREDFLELVEKKNPNTKEKEMLPYWSEGEKAIIYDLATQSIPNQAHIDFSLIDLDNYVTNIKIIYEAHKSTIMINLVNMIIRKMNLEPKSPDISVSNMNFGGYYNDTGKGITSK